jgi:hypothetical protein
MIKEQLMLAIARGAERVVQDHAEGSQTVRGLDASTVERIANAVLAFVADPPLGEDCRNYRLGGYSRANLEAFVNDIR